MSFFINGGIFTTRSKIYEARDANHGVHFVQEPQDTIILDGTSITLTSTGAAATCHYGINQGKAANTDIQAPPTKSLLIAQILVTPATLFDSPRTFKVMASNTVDTDDGTELWSGTVTANAVYAPYPLILPANKYLTLVFVTQPSANRDIAAREITVIEENTA